MGAMRSLGRLLLRLYPAEFRRAHGEEILRSLDEDLHDAESARGPARVWARARAVIDVGRAGLLLRGEALRTLRPSRAPDRGRKSGPDPGGEMFSGLVTDLRYAARTLRASTGFTVVSVITLALAIGAGVTLFSVVNGVLLRPLPYAAPDRLVNIWNDLGRGAQSLPAVHPADFRDYQAWSRLFEEFAAATGGRPLQIAGIVTGDGTGAEHVDVSAVTANFFPLLGVAPLLGRAFAVEDEHPGAPCVAVLAHSLWQRRFGADRGLAGRRIQIDGRTCTAVGVLPPGFRLYLPAEAFLVKDAEVWLPLSLDYARLPPRNFTYLTVFGRLAPAVTLRQAQQEMDAIAARLRREHPEHSASNLRIRVVPLHHDVVKHARPALLILLAAVGVVILIGCANVANLLLSRAATRRRELAVHAALGASRWRIVRRLLVESFLLALLGTAAGVGLARAALSALAALLPATLPRMQDTGIDSTVLAAVSVSCVLTTLLCGVLPARHASTRNTVADLKDAAWGSEGARQDRARTRLVVGEIALSLVLIVAAVLLVRSALALQRASPGFDTQGVLTFRLALPSQAYPRSADRRAFLDRLQQRVQRLPRVETVGAASQLPLTGSGPLAPYAYDEETARNWETVTADERDVSPEFFPAIGAQLLAGRAFTEQDGSDGRRVIIVDDELAQRVWKGRSAVGQRLQVEPTGSDDPHAEVIGVVRHLRLHDLTRPVRPQIWGPLLGGVGTRLSFAVRTHGDPALLVEDVRRAIAEIDPALAPRGIQPISVLVSEASAQVRLNASVMLAFGVLALVLAAVGVYGVITYSVSQRTREFGIRQALGQEPAAVRRMVLAEAARLGTTAIVLGLAVSAVSAGVLEALLYATDPRDPLVLAGASAFLLMVVLAAAWVPARRATSVDPHIAMRCDHV